MFNPQANCPLGAATLGGYFRNYSGRTTLFSSQDVLNLLKGNIVIETRSVSGSPSFTFCKWCGTSIPISKKRGRPKKFCKNSCKQRAYESRKFGIGEMWDLFENTYSDCYLCQQPLDWDDPQSLCVDHVIATVHGGRTDIENLRPVHLICNLRKGYSLIEDPHSSKPN